MSWFVVIPVAWTLLALLVGLVVGRSIRMSGDGPAVCPLATAAESPDGSASSSPAGMAQASGADLPVPATHGQRPEGRVPHHRRARAHSLSTAR